MIDVSKIATAAAPQAMEVMRQILKDNKRMVKNLEAIHNYTETFPSESVALPMIHNIRLMAKQGLGR